MLTELTAVGPRNYLLALLSAVFLVLMPLDSICQVTGVKAADQSCQKCHREIYKTYLATPMANASGPATEKLFPGSYVHKASGIEYDIAAAGGVATLNYKDRSSQSPKGSVPLNYFLGSGHLGTTYLYSINKHLFESPVAWYSDLQAYDMKPGLAGMKEIPPALPMQSGCLRCHMSDVQPTEAGTLNLYRGEPFLHTGITCEACHGDTQKHVQTRGKASVLNPLKLDADRRDSICISCHLEGDVKVERAGQSALDYRPGESISKYLAYFVYGGANPTARGVSEVEQFAKSTCKRMSGDKMSCTNCHDPHFTPGPEQRTAFFRGKCLACHSEPQFALKHHPENQDCTSCHMGRTGAQNIPHVAWTDHRILKVPAAPTADLQADSKEDLAAVFSPGATGRDLAMGYYTLMLEGNRAAAERAWPLLKEQKQQINGDAPALDAMGVMMAENGESKDAEQIFRRVLELSPNDLTALSNLGILVARQGDLPQAAKILERAFERNADVSGLAMNLARVQCAAGDAKAAQVTLESTLVYNPGLGSVRRLMQGLTDCGTAGNR